MKGEKMKKLTIWFIATMLVVLAVSFGIGCKETAAVEDEELIIGFAWDYVDNIARIAEEDLARRAAEEAGARVIFTSADTDSTRQHTNIEDLISRGVDAILAIPVDSKAIAAGIKLAQDAGIPFVTIDRTTSPEAEYHPDGFASTDSTKQAYDAGIALADVLDEDGVTAKTFVLIGDLRDENAINRDNGFRQAAEERGMEIIADFPTEWNPERALTGTTDALMGYPDINTIFLPSDFLLPAVQSALDGAGKWAVRGEPNHIYIASQDVFPSGYRAVRDGYIDSNTAWDIQLFAEEGVDMCIKLAMGETLDDPIRLVEGRTITLENVNDVEGLWGQLYSE